MRCPACVGQRRLWCDRCGGTREVRDMGWRRDLLVIALAFAAVMCMGWCSGAAHAVAQLCTADPTPADRALIARAIRCHRAPEPVDVADVQTALCAERAVGMPAGMSLTAACHESGLSNAKGDCRLRDDCPAQGWWQMWPWWEKLCDRNNPQSAALAWTGRVARGAAMAARDCGAEGLDAWRIGWATAVRSCLKRGGKCRARCTETPKAWARWLRWSGRDRMSMELASGQGAAGGVL